MTKVQIVPNTTHLAPLTAHNHRLHSKLDSLRKRLLWITLGVGSVGLVALASLLRG